MSTMESKGRLKKGWMGFMVGLRPTFVANGTVH